MEYLNEKTNLPKQRHGCVTAWLILMIILNSLAALLYLFAGDTIAQGMPAGITHSILIVLGVLGIANVIFAVMLYNWKKLGFWGFVITSIGSFIINITSGLSTGQSFVGLVGIAVLYGILQITKDDVSAWDHLE